MSKEVFQNLYPSNKTRKYAKQINTCMVIWRLGKYFVPKTGATVAIKLGYIFIGHK